MTSTVVILPESRGVAAEKAASSSSSLAHALGLPQTAGVAKNTTSSSSLGHTQVGPDQHASSSRGEPSSKPSFAQPTQRPEHPSISAERPLRPQSSQSGTSNNLPRKDSSDSVTYIDVDSTPPLPHPESVPHQASLPSRPTSTYEQPAPQTSPGPRLTMAQSILVSH